MSIVIILLCTICFSCDRQKHQPPNINVIPTPQKIKFSTGYFEITPSTTICINDNSQFAGEYLKQQFLQAAGFDLKINKEKSKGAIVFTSNEDLKDANKESYSLSVNPQNVEISANSEAGYFYAVQTLLQLLPPEIFSKEKQANVKWKILCLSIQDSPKYGWRSFMLDSGRQFQTVEFIKRYLDIMAMLKMNVFHWHLTEGQGWRIEIKQYPKLTEIGSRVADGEEQQGFYTHEDMKEIVEYARQRFITVVPEIDVPGHATAALISYPELTCSRKAPQSVMGYSPDLICGGDEASYTFLENVLDEVCELFPGEYIHLGGDEAPKDIWDNCPVCQKKIKDEGLKNSNDLQRYFSKRLALYLKKKNKKAIFWGDVVYEDGEPLPDNVIVYWWNSRGHGDLAYKNAVKRGHPVICGTNAYCYLNYPVVPWSKYDHTRIFDLKTTYDKNPSDLSEPDELVLGMGCCQWTDWYVKMSMIDQRVFPRIYSLAEQMWHKGERLTFEKFYERIKANYPRLEILGINYGPAKADEVPDGYKWE
jgi:hexosaminidase